MKGFPEPEVIWTFNDQPLIEVTHLLDYQLMLGGKVLQIPEVDEQTVGVFVCNTTNPGGELLTSLQLKLIGNRFFSFFSSNTKRTYIQK